MFCIYKYMNEQKKVCEMSLSITPFDMSLGIYQMTQQNKKKRDYSCKNAGELMNESR